MVADVAPVRKSAVRSSPVTGMSGDGHMAAPVEDPCSHPPSLAENRQGKRKDPKQALLSEREDGER